MPYTWRGSSAVGFDLSRTAGGAGVAGVLVTALRADAGYVGVLGNVPPPAARDRARGRAAVSAAGSPVAARRGVALPSAQLDDVRFGRPVDLLTLVRLDLPTSAGVSPTAGAAAEEHLRDAVVANLLPADVDRELARTLQAGYDQVGRDRTATADLGPGGADIEHVLRLIATGRAADPLGLLTATRRGDGGARWVKAMHGVSWAAELSGRSRSLACANMLLVEALATAGYTADDCVRGVWNAASGIVCAYVVADLLPDLEFGVLTRA